MRPNAGFQERYALRYSKRAPDLLRLMTVLMVLGLFMGGCSGMGKTVGPREEAVRAPRETIISGNTGEKLTYPELLEHLVESKIVYIGESHTQREHHRIQLRILQDLADRLPGLRLGVEMIDKSYQPVLDEWIQNGSLDREWFLEKTHWYANWRFPFDLYAEIFYCARDRHIPLFGLNLPFHIPPKIAIGGLDSLMAADASFLAKHIDLSSAAHRRYIQDIYEKHRKNASLKDHFDYFYAAQCAWEDTMAESIARHIEGGPMVVLVGNGHIVHKFGIPDRAFVRTGLPFVTVYLSTEEEPTELGIADYIWKIPKSAVHTPASENMNQEKP
jgi:uncharacterized iron-regulated protein